MTEHVLDLSGTGHFSKGKCTGCDWALNGHADEIRRVWGKYHQGDNVIDLPRRPELPPPATWAPLADIEKRIIILLTYRVDFGKPEALFVAQGLAEAREALMEGSMADAPEYISIMMARVASLSKRQREKLRHPSRNREEQQRLLEDG